MKKELPENIRSDIAESRELLKRSKELVSEVKETVERSWSLLEQSYRLIDKFKSRLPFRDDRER
jgi:predicted nuclease with TOPRIM domain